MKAIDVNIAIRWLTNDEPGQAALAVKLLKQPVYLSLIVLIEIAWVLKRSYGLGRADLNEAVSVLIDLETVTVASEGRVRWALERHRAGADLPDMLHLIAAHGAASFVTFERRLARQAGPNSPLPIETLS